MSALENLLTKNCNKLRKLDGTGDFWFYRTSNNPVTRIFDYHKKEKRNEKNLNVSQTAEKRRV